MYLFNFLYLNKRPTYLIDFVLVSKVDLQDKEFLQALANHAQALAKIILKRTNSGHHLAEDAQVNTLENSKQTTLSKSDS